MYDSVNLRLLQSDVADVSFLEETATHLQDVGEHQYGNDSIVLTGRLGGLKISLNEYQLKIKDGSLCKWFLGDNFQTMGRGDVQRAIEKLSDTLHLPVDKATVTRLDVAQNFICKHPPFVYLNHLGALRYATRLQEPSGLYYQQTGGRLCFYDKNKEQKSKREPIPPLYQNRNVLRYEQRYTQRLATQFNVVNVTGALLYDETFYIEVLKRWRDTYYNIKKINDVTLNFSQMKSKQQLYKMGVLSLVKQAGGELYFMEQIDEAQNSGELTRKQAYDLRQAVKEACKVESGLTVQNEAIKELDRKVADAVKFYR